MQSPRRTGILFVLSAPSGAGKSTLCQRLAKDRDAGLNPFIYSVSCTTRPPRQGEVDGVDYHFLSHAEFERLIEEGEFLEYAKVHGNYYGTRRSNILASLNQGVDVLLDIDTQGAAKIRANPDPEIRRALVDIFLMPPSLQELERRLLQRGTETPEQVAVRLANAEEEMAQWVHYRYTIPATSIEGVYNDFMAIMRAERLNSRRLHFPNHTP